MSPMSAGPSLSFFAILRKLYTSTKAIFPPTLSIHGGNSLLLKHWTDPPIRTGFGVSGTTSRPHALFGSLVAINFREKTCDLIARMCLRGTQTAVSTATEISQQVNFLSITLSPKARAVQLRGIISCVRVSAVMYARVDELPERPA